MSFLPVHLGTLTPRQARALEQFLSGKNVSEVARTLGLRRATVSGWYNHHPVFRAQLEAAHAEQREAIRSRLSAAGRDAVDALHELVKAEGAPRVRLLAANAILRLLVGPPKTLAHGEQSPHLSPTVLANDGRYTGEAVRKRMIELSQFTPTERENMRVFWEHLVDGSKEITAAGVTPGQFREYLDQRRNGTASAAEAPAPASREENSGAH